MEAPKSVEMNHSQWKVGNWRSPRSHRDGLNKIALALGWGWGAAESGISLQL